MRGIRRSRLEIYLDILQALIYRPLKFTHIMYKANVNSAVLKEGLDFLIQKSLVLEKFDKNEKVYAVTTKGLTVLKHFEEVEQVFPFIKEENRIQ